MLAFWNNMVYNNQGQRLKDTADDAEIAQLVEHFTRNEGVEGSSPFFSLT